MVATSSEYKSNSNECSSVRDIVGPLTNNIVVAYNKSTAQATFIDT